MKKVFFYLFGLIAVVFFVYLTTPTLHYKNPALWITVVVIGFIYGGIQSFIKSDYDIDLKPFVVPGILLGILVLVAVINSPMFRTKAYQQLLGEQKVSNFTKDISPISLTEMRIVDDSIAHKLGDKVLGKDPALGSIVEVKNYDLQSIRGKLYHVAPLEHSGFFKWYNNGYTTGYIRVSATNMNDVTLVEKDKNGKDIKIVYQPSAYFGQDLERHLWLNGYATTFKTDYVFEVDEDDRPWWVVTTYEKKIMFSGNDANGVLVINPETGEIHEYTIENAPKWIDRIQPTEFILNQIEDWGEYIKGFWNWSGRGKLKPSKGSSIVYGHNGDQGDRCYVYTGITSVGADEGTVGFLMVDTRTKEVFRYNRAGATEEAAMRSAESMVQEKGYHATFPVPYNVEGVPTYFMSLVGKDGLPKMHAFVSIENYGTVGIGKDIQSTHRSYKRALTSNGNVVGINSGYERKKASGVIVRISKDIVDGQTNYYFMLKAYPYNIFSTSSNLSPEILLSQAGDSVHIVYDDSGQDVIQVEAFDNLNIDLKSFKNKEMKEKYFKEVDSLHFRKEEVKNANEVFNRMTDEEKLKLLQKK